LLAKVWSTKTKLMQHKDFLLTTTLPLFPLAVLNRVKGVAEFCHWE
jgi:hypothetical protein